MTGLQTRDVFFAAYLQVRGFQLAFLDYSNGWVEFTFNLNGSDPREVRGEWEASQLAAKYVAAVREMTSLMQHCRHKGQTLEAAKADVACP